MCHIQQQKHFIDIKRNVLQLFAQCNHRSGKSPYRLYTTWHWLFLSTILEETHQRNTKHSVCKNINMSRMIEIYEGALMVLLYKGDNNYTSTLQCHLVVYIIHYMCFSTEFSQFHLNHDISCQCSLRSKIQKEVSVRRLISNFSFKMQQMKIL